ncbi:MAG TPA: hypothetical protein VFN52_04585, partial [Acidiferrobacteraceae bacterium]|nr:hypothetical protein [Acidiferrobacteraceae bacterium]
MKAWIQISRVGATVLLGVAYSFISFRAQASGRAGVAALACAFAPVLLALLGFAWGQRQRLLAVTAWSLLTLVLWHFRAVFFRNFSWAYLAQHAGSLALLAWVFGRTLSPGRVPMVTQFSTLVHGSLSPALMRYTRQVTVAWTLLFTLMAVSSLTLFVLGSLRAWSVFANMLTAPLVGLMFAGEYLVRRSVLPRGECPSLGDTFVACYRRFA